MNPLASIFNRMRTRRVTNELLGLDDRLLRDIGLTRADLFRMNSHRSPRRD